MADGDGFLGGMHADGEGKGMPDDHTWKKTKEAERRSSGSFGVWSDFVGVWQLMSVEYRDEHGEVTPTPFGEMVGTLIYTVEGTVAVQMYRVNRPHFSVPDPYAASDEQTRLAFEGMNCYYGSYKVDPVRATVTHYIEDASLPNRQGGALLRSFSFQENGDQLTLRAVPRLLRGKNLTGQLVWKRIHSSVQP
mmetsp:Transcript_26793/g.74891  ORF Transcript_26793/g.74891 Transcript_26793/m.74891 type:complete len:192 (+) Transcript_26793:66-641(+)